MSSSKRSTGIRLLVLFLGSGAVGWLLTSYKASLVVWLLTEAVMLYLAWAGTGAIALSVVGALGILWSATLFHREAEFLVWFDLPFTPAQHWATELLLNWLLAMVLIFKIAFANQWLCTNGWNRAKTFCLLAIVTSFGLSLVQLMNMLLSREAQLFVGWVSDSVTHAGIGFHASTQPTSILYLIPPTYLPFPFYE